ncbi:MAG: TniB family NTP-binding protein [Xenococcaceae cyanobacterium MO_188.B32]|nr:TniB family NTP-binding protein [Xenococcaceae cyanobacterium MO_188.B32]
MTNTQTVANQFGGFEPPPAEIQAEIERLSRQPYLELNRVKNCHDWMYELLMSKSTGLLVGASRSGKTVTCKSFEERYNKFKSGKGKRIKPVVYIQIPVSCGSRDFFIKILKVLNKPTNGNVSDLRERTLDALAIHQVEMLIVDEANHLEIKTFSDLRHVYDEDELNLAVLLVGTTNRLHAVVQRDEQVVNRFLEEYELDRLDDKEFKQIVGIWERDVLRLPEPSNLTKGKTFTTLKTATNKLIGRLDMILRKSAIRSLRQGYKKVDLDILQQVMSSTKWSYERKRK